MNFTTVRLREVQQSLTGDRIDAEFYGQDYLDTDKVIDRVGYKTLGSITSKIDVGYVGPMVSEYTERGTWLLQTQNVRGFFLDGSNKTLINPSFHNQLNKSKVRKGNILIARSGSFGTASIYLEQAEVNSSDIIIVDTVPGEINRYYLLAFLNCAYGTNQMLRYASGGLQGHVNLTILASLKVPILSDTIQKSIESTILRSHLWLKEADQMTQQAELLLLSEIGLADWNPERQPESVRSFSDVFSAGRIDAEYYQPEYDEILDAIRDYSGGWDTLGNLVRLKDLNFEPDDTAIYKYIELANIGANGEITDVLVAPGVGLPTRARRQVATGDVIVSSIEGSLGSIAMIDGEYDGALCSTGFHVVDSRTFNSETLLVLLKSVAGQLQLKKGCSGTILTAINKHEFRKVVLPKVTTEVQDEVQRMVKESAALRRHSRELLEYAKRAVEVAIEQDETIAIEWLDRALAQDEANGPAKRGFNNEAIDRLVALRQEIFGGKPLPGNSAAFIREAREERSKQMDNWR